MIRLRHLAGILLMFIATGAMAQAVTFFERENFRGRNFVVNGPVADFQRFGFNDRASSVVIRRGPWELCSDRRFGGRCVTLRSGSYASLRAMGLSQRVSSARPLGNPGLPPLPPPRPPQGGTNPVTLFDGVGLSGERFRVTGDINNLDGTRWNDRARSMIVRQGRWQLCTDAFFRGNCQVFSQGRYDTIGNQSGSMSSIRRVR